MAEPPGRELPAPRQSPAAAARLAPPCLGSPRFPPAPGPAATPRGEGGGLSSQGAGPCPQRGAMALRGGQWLESGHRRSLPEVN